MEKAEPEVGKSECSLWDKVMIRRIIADESLAGVKNAALDANVVENPLSSIQTSQGRRRGKAWRRSKRSNGAEDELNHGQPPKTPDAIDEAQIEATSDKPKQGKMTKPKPRYIAVTPEEAELVLSPRAKTKYDRLRNGVSEWRKLIRQIKAAEKWGIPPTSQQEKQLKIGKDLNNQLERMKDDIQKKLIDSGKARPEVLERVQKNREYMKAYHAGYNRLNKKKHKAKYQADKARMKFLEDSKANRDLTRKEQKELDALQAKRDHRNARHRGYRRRAKEAKSESRSQDVSDPNPSGEDTPPSSENPPTNNRLEMSTGQQPDTMDPSTAQIRSPVVNRRLNQWHTNLLRFGNTILEKLSRMNDRLHTFPGIPPVVPLTPSGPVPAPRAVF